MTRSADQEYITTAIGKKYRVEKSSDFAYATTAIGEECFLFGVDETCPLSRCSPRLFRKDNLLIQYLQCVLLQTVRFVSFRVGCHSKIIDLLLRRTILEQRNCNAANMMIVNLIDNRAIGESPDERLGVI